MKVRPDRVAVRNDPPTATPGRRLACPLHSRRAQQPYASAKPAHGLGRCRSAENGPVDRCPTTLTGVGPRRLKEVRPRPSIKTSQLLMSRQSERRRRPPRGRRQVPRGGPRVRAAANALARNRMRRGASAFRNCALLPLGDGRVYVRPPRNLVKRRGDRVLQPAANDPANDPRESGCTRILASDFFLPNPGGADPGGTQENTQF
jgi:hypothetical protein